MRTGILRRHLLTSAATLAISTGPLLSGSAVAADVDTSANQLPEVIVTAQKRSEDLTKVPSSISVIKGDALGSSGINDFDDLSRAVPGLSVQAGASEGSGNLQIRGISATAGDSTVSVYLNETPITVSSRFGGATQPIPFDIAQVEVLRGPQGTLYGASALGGTLRYIQNKPDLNTYSGFVAGDLSGTVHGGINYETSALVNIPVIAGQFAVRIGGLYGSDSGWIDQYNLYGQLQTPGTNSDKKKLLRVAALYQPTDDLSISSNITYQRSDQKDISAFYTDAGVANSLANSLDSGVSPYTASSGLFKESSQIRGWTHDSVLVADLGINKDLGFATLTSDSSYFYRSYNQLFDGTYYNSGAFNSYYLPAQFTPSPLLAFAPSPSYQPVGWDTWTQELRLTSPDNPPYPLKWVAGLYVTQQHVGYTQNEIDPEINSIFQKLYGVPIGSISAAEGGPANYNNFFNPIFSSASKETDDQYAAFASVTYDIRPDLHLTAGLRYTLSHEINVSNNLLTSFYDVGLAAEAKSTIKNYSATPRFSLAYDINDTSSIYTTEAKGFRLGGPSGQLPTGPGNVCSQDYANLGISGPPSSYSPDSLWSYEAGIKTTALDHTLSVNAAGYYINWTNAQQSVNLPICGFGYTANAGDAEVYGSELEVVYAPPMLKGLKLGVTGAFNHTSITKTTATFATVGEALEDVPERTATLSADYDFPLMGGWNGFVHGDYNFNGHSHGSFQTDLPNFENQAYGVVNAQFGVDDENWKVYLFAKNLLNDHTIYQQIEQATVVEGYTARPLTVGISARRDF